MRRTIAPALLLWYCAAMAQTQPTVAEDKPFKLAVPALVGYGAGAKWAAKLLPAGNHKCNNATFGDPAYGVVKACVGYAINTVTCGLEAGTNTDAKVSTSGVWLSHWCPTSTGTALHIVAGTWAATPAAAECYAKAAGSSVDRLKACAPGDVTSAALAPTWSGDAARIFNTRPK
jgi:hypothetical protein